jgi:hypothetical protein
MEDNKTQPGWVPRNEADAVILIKQVFEDARLYHGLTGMKYDDVYEYLKKEFKIETALQAVEKQQHIESSPAQEFTPGEEVEVKSNRDGEWRTRFYVGVTKSNVYVTEDKNGVIDTSWCDCRKPKQSVEEWTREWFTHNAWGKMIDHDKFYQYWADRSNWEKEDRCG